MDVSECSSNLTPPTNDELYFTKLTGICPPLFWDELDTLVKFCFFQVLDDAAKKICETPTEMISKHDIEEGFSQLKMSTNKTLKKHMPKLQNNLAQSIFYLPKDFLASCDLVQDTPSSVAEVHDLQLEIEQLLQQLEHSKLIEMKMEEELTSISAVKICQKQALESMASSKGNTFNELFGSLVRIGSDARPMLSLTDNVSQSKSNSVIDVKFDDSFMLKKSE